MKLIFHHFPLILAAVLLALFTSGAMGQTYILSHLFGETYLPFTAEGIFFALTIIYVLFLWLLRISFSSRGFTVSLWLLNAILLFMLICLMLD